MSEGRVLKKQYNILPSITAAIKALVKIGEVASKVEYFGTLYESAALKKMVREFEYDHYQPLKTLVSEVKAGIDIKDRERKNDHYRPMNKENYLKHKKNKKHDTDNTEL